MQARFVTTLRPGARQSAVQFGAKFLALLACAVLDRNIEEMYDRGEGYDIAKAKVDLTFFEGELIYERK